MAKVALTVAGGIIGSAVGMPGLGAMLGGQLGGYIERRGADPIRQEGPRLDDLHVQVSSYGSPIFRVWGTMRVAGNIIWSGDKVQSSTTETSGGGKAGPEVATTAYHYHSSFAIAICAGPIDRLLRIWADGKLIYSIVPTNDSIIGISGLNFTLYEGNETQVADPIIEAEIGAGDVPGFRGLCYIVFDTFPLALFGNRIPNFSFDVTTNASEDDVPYTVLNDFIDPSEWTEDRIVFFPDGINFIVEQLQTWAKFNTTNNALIKSVDYTDSSDRIPVKYGSPPYETVNFDIDENNIIYTISGHSTTGHRMCRLDGITLALIDTKISALTVDAKYLRVFQNPDYPFTVSFDPSAIGTHLYIYHRTTYAFIDAYSALATVYWRSVDLDHVNGIIYAVGRTETPNSSSAVWKFQLRTDGTFESVVVENLNFNDPGAVIADEISFDSESNQVIIGDYTNNELRFFDVDDLSTVIAIVSVPIDFKRVKSNFRQGVQNGFLYLHTTTGGNNVNRIDVSAYASTRSWELTDSAVVWNGGACYDPLTHSMIIGIELNGDPRIIKMNLDRSDSTRVPLSDIVNDICEISGLNPTTEIDTTALTTLVHGFVVNENMRGRAALEILMQTFFFTAVESDGILKFVNKGGSVVAAILEVDLAAHIANSERPQQLITTRQEEIGLPAELNFMYLDALTNYQVNVQRAQRRQTTSSKDVLTVRTPVALEPDDAKQICAKMYNAAWTERTGHTIIVSRKYMHLDPGDVITVTEDGVAHTVRIETMQYGAGIISMELVNEDAGSYISLEEGFELPQPDEIIVEYPGPSLLVIVDIPFFPIGIVPGVVLAVQGYSEFWKGAQVLRSPPQGVV